MTRTPTAHLQWLVRVNRIYKPADHLSFDLLQRVICVLSHKFEKKKQKQKKKKKKKKKKNSLRKKKDT